MRLMLLNYSPRLLRFLLLSILAALLPRLSPAQQLPLAKDYFITATGDTLRGELQFSQLVTDNGVTLLPAGGGPRRTYRATESRGFGMADGRRFVIQRIKVFNLVPVPASPTDDAQNLLPVFMQHLVRGKANLYRLDYNVAAVGTPLQYSRYETAFFYIQVPNSGLFVLQQANFKSIIKTMFKDCPLVQKTVSDTRFDEDGLAALVLRYNAACGSDGAAPTDLRRTLSRQERLVVGVRVGAGGGSTSYSQSQLLSASTMKWGSNFTVGLSLSGVGQRRLTPTLGVYYTTRRSSGTYMQVVPVGFINQGATLALEQSVATSALQVPIGLRYSFPALRLAPFVAAAIAAGYTIRNTTSQTALASDYDPRYFLPVQTGRQVSAADANISKGPLLGVQAGGGIRPQVGTRALVLEAYFEKGYELTSNEIVGRLSYVGALVRVGVDF